MEGDWREAFQPSDWAFERQSAKTRQALTRAQSQSHLARGESEIWKIRMPQRLERRSERCYFKLSTRWFIMLHVVLMTCQGPTRLKL